MATPLHPLHAHHERTFRDNRFVYPVISRRSGGISIGVNLNPDKICNFDCVYCQVNRREEGETEFVDMPRLLEELRAMLEAVARGDLFKTPEFAATPLPLRRLNDIAFSGDGEPTTHRNFDEIIAACAEVKRFHRLEHVKLVLITNASMLHRPHVQRGLELLDANQGEIWGKLDAGTDDYFRKIDRTPIPFQQILDNLVAAAKVRPLVIQSLFMRVHQEPPPPTECEAFCQRLNDIVAGGGSLSLVQIYTIARRPAESFVSPLTDAEVDALAQLVRSRTGLPTLPFYGA